MKWKFWPIFWRALKRTCTFLGATVLVMSILTFWSASTVLNEVEPQLPDEMVLYMPLKGKLKDLSDEVNFADPFAGTGPTMRDFINTLDHAKNDPRVQGIFARLEQGGYSLAHIQEMRAAIKRFKESGKFAYIYAASYGQFGGMGEYYLASAFEELWMMPLGTLAVTGVNAETPFLRGMLDELGIEPQFFQRKEYKSAYESLNRKNISKANREMMTRIISDITGTIASDISADRGLLKGDFKKRVDQGLFMGEDAVKAGLIDQADYADVLVKKINKAVTGNPDNEDLSYIMFSDYMREYKSLNNQGLAQSFMPQENKSRAKPGVALVYAVGVIMPRDKNASASSSLLDDGIAAADEIAEAILDAAQDEHIKAIVLRVDSPGGSPEASETILRAVEIAKEKGKMVIVSMGPSAASGGYWISAYADRIFVLPSTLTGSIGVLGGKVSLKELWKKVGVNWDNIGWGDNAAIWSMNTPFSKGESERMNAMLDHIYKNFIARVAKGRDMSEADVEKIARGRVWTGKSALEIGLADEIGGLDAALDYTARQMGRKDRTAIDVVIMPHPLNPFEQLIKMLEGQVMSRSSAARTQAQIVEMLKPAMAQWTIYTNPQDYTVYNKIEIR